MAEPTVDTHHTVAVAVIVCVGAAVGGGGAVLTLLHPTTPVGTALRLLTVLALTAALAWLSAIDQRSHRLPDRIVLPTLACLAVLGVLIAWADGDWERLGRAVLGAAALFGGFLLLGVIAAGSLGGGDVKLAAVIGGAAAWCGWTTLALAVVVAFVAAGSVSAVLMLARRVRRDQRVPFGPALCFGLGVAMLVG